MDAQASGWSSLPLEGSCGRGHYYGILCNWLGEPLVPVTREHRQAATASSRDNDRQSVPRERDVRPPVGSETWLGIKAPWPREWKCHDLSWCEPERLNQIRLFDDQRLCSFWWPLNLPRMDEIQVLPWIPEAHERDSADAFIKLGC